jgi:predicted secreted hydrolase
VIRRRVWLRASAASWLVGSLAEAYGVTAKVDATAEPDYAPVLPGVALRFPRDHGAHLAWRTEWWYVTGWLSPGAVARSTYDAPGRDWGFQVTFFRVRLRQDPRNRSRFAPRQLLFAHAALARPDRPRLRHAQRVARAGAGRTAAAEEGDTAVAIGDWSLRRDADDRYRATIPAGDFRLDLRFDGDGRPPVAQGDAGFSRKGPEPLQASHYYSRPNLKVSGHVGIGDEPGGAVHGRAWLDHEWSSRYLADGAQGWDWVGLNFDDGGALMAFRIRRRDSHTLWRAAMLVLPDGSQQPIEADFEPLRWWHSPRTGGRYPVSLRIRAGALTLVLEPLLDDQELDTRGSTGTVYWEGAVRAKRDGQEIGRGYLELTGYVGALRF